MKRIILIIIIIAAITAILRHNYFCNQLRAVFSSHVNNSEYSMDFIPTSRNIYSISDLQNLKRFVYTIEPDAYVTEKDLDIERLMDMNFKTNLKDGGPKVLIFHTHSQEFYADSVNGQKSIVDIGSELSDILAKEYSIPVIHDMGKYDYNFEEGRIQREGSYENMEPAIKRLLEKYPTIEVAIDLHRDSLPDNKKLVTTINGKPTAKVMYFNGIAAQNVNGQPKYVEGETNPYLKENLGLSLQMQLKSNELYPNFTRKIYIRPYRYSLHMLPKSLLIEVGSDTNTYQEAINAMGPLAKVLVEVISGD